MQAETAKGESRALSPFALAAGAYTACGLMAIPLERGGKRPVFDWKKFQGQRLVDQDWDKADEYILRWWGRPDPYNVGVLTGGQIYLDEHRTSSLVVVDVDDQDARDLVERTCGWSLTPTVKTSKGWHLWFACDHPGGNRAKVADVGLDVRGAGGYVVTPPSVHPSGSSYEWLLSITEMWPPASLPDELHELLWPRRHATVSGAPVPVFTTKYVAIAVEREVTAVAAAPEGTRNDQLNRSAFALARFVHNGSLSASQYVEQLITAAARAGLPETEIRRTLASALQGRH